MNCLRSLPCWAPRLSLAPLASSWTSLPATSHAGNPTPKTRLVDDVVYDPTDWDTKDASDEGRRG